MLGLAGDGPLCAEQFAALACDEREECPLTLCESCQVAASIFDNLSANADGWIESEGSIEKVSARCASGHIQTRRVVSTFSVGMLRDISLACNA